ncbi:hypothetical protein ACFL2H_13390, partial [Planctomycetota bacterium]
MANLRASIIDYNWPDAIPANAVDSGEARIVPPDCGLCDRAMRIHPETNYCRNGLLIGFVIVGSVALFGCGRSASKHSASEESSDATRNEAVPISPGSFQQTPLPSIRSGNADNRFVRLDSAESGLNFVNQLLPDHPL